MGLLDDPKLWILLGSAGVTLALLAGLGGRPVVRAVLALDRMSTGIAGVAACLALAVAVVAGLWQVVSRFATETPAVWSEALVRTALVWMALLGLSVAIRVGALVSIDVAHRLSTGAVRRALEAAALATSLAMMGVLFWYGWDMAMRVRFQEMAGLEISIAWGYAAIPVGAVFAAIGAMAHFLDRRSEELESAV